MVSDGSLVETLLAIPGMTDPGFRRLLYHELPCTVQEQLPHHESARVELLGVVATLTEYRHLGAWESLVAGIRTLVSDHPAVADLVATLTRAGLLGC